MKDFREKSDVKSNKMEVRHPPMSIILHALVQEKKFFYFLSLAKRKIETSIGDPALTIISLQLCVNKNSSDRYGCSKRRMHVGLVFKIYFQEKN